MSIYVNNEVKLSHSLNHVQFHPNQPLLASVSEKSKLQIFQIDQKPAKLLHTLEVSSAITSISWPSTGAKILSFSTTNGDINILDAGQTNKTNFTHHKFLVHKNPKHPPKLTWTKNGARIIYISGKDIFGFRFDIRSGMFMKIFQKTYFYEIGLVSPLVNLNLLLTSVMGDIFYLKDQEIVQICKLQNKNEIKQAFQIEPVPALAQSPQPNSTSPRNILSPNHSQASKKYEFVIFSDVLTFIRNDKISLQVKLSKDTKILPLPNNQILAYYANEIRIFDINQDYTNSTFPFKFDENIKDMTFDEKLNVLAVATGSKIEFFQLNLESEGVEGERWSQKSNSINWDWGLKNA